VEISFQQQSEAAGKMVRKSKKQVSKNTFIRESKKSLRDYFIFACCDFLKISGTPNKGLS
jgi:hypothetical protein